MEGPNPDTIKLRFIWIDQDGRYNCKNVYYPGQVQVEYNLETSRQTEKELVQVLTKVLGHSSQDNEYRLIKKEALSSSDANSLPSQPRVKKEKESASYPNVNETEEYHQMASMEAGATTHLGRDAATNEPIASKDRQEHSPNTAPLPSLKLRIKKEVKYYSNADGSQVVYNDYTTSHSALDESSEAQSSPSSVTVQTMLQDLGVEANNEEDEVKEALPLPKIKYDLMHQYHY